MRAIRPALLALALLLPLLGCSEESSTTPTTFPTQGLLAFLPFNGDASDQSGNGNHGILLGGATASGALLLGDNATDRLSLPASAMDGLTDFTFAAWLRLDALRGESHEVISGANASDDNNLVFWYREQTGEWAVGVYNGNATLASDARIEDGQWHHVALTRSAEHVQLYVDGAGSGNPVTQPTGAIAIDAGGLVFGQDQDTVGGDFEADEAWAGAMDDLRIYARALSPGEIGKLADESR